MARPSRENPEVREFLLRNMEAHPHDIAAAAGKQFGLSRPAINNYLKRLEAVGLIAASGKTKARRYSLKVLADNTTILPITKGIYESDVWVKFIAPHVRDLKPNVEAICLYAFTEIFNNVIDHSQSSDAIISYEQTYTTTKITIMDHGVGIFEKLQKDFNLPDARTALLELSKGKLTSDATRHTGEGIFFTSRMLDQFSILSGNLYYRRKRQEDWGWLIETDNIAEYTQGTFVTMMIATDANWTTQQVFEKYSEDVHDDGAPLFVKTHVPIALGKYGNEQLVSRSQAKRILARFDRFQEVFLDFGGVETIGQAFADEIFRVYRTQNPNIRIVAIHTSPEVDRMIRHVQQHGAEPAPAQLELLPQAKANG
ncbi:MAG: STAS-like domain-containing protein [Alphaproteobacteria bacterium]